MSPDTTWPTDRRVPIPDPFSPLTGTSYRAYTNARRQNRISKASGPCGLCGRIKAQGIPIVVDHCHLCGIIRGEICGECNINMHAADQAASKFSHYTVDWLREVNAILAGAGKRAVTLADEVNKVIDRLHYFISQVGAAEVFAYQKQCACPSIHPSHIEGNS